LLDGHHRVIEAAWAGLQAALDAAGKAPRAKAGRRGGQAGVKAKVAVRTGSPRRKR